MESFRGSGQACDVDIGCTDALPLERAPSPAPYRVRVRHADTGRVLAEHALHEGVEIVVGSAEGVGLRVAERTVSRRHARLVARPTGVWVEDLGATNGVEIAGVRVSSAALQEGDFATLGRVRLELASARGREPELAEPLPLLVGDSTTMRRLAARVRRIAPLELPVLVRGPSGSGKELVARSLHELSGRAGPFVAINAATIGRELAESELFGHLRGAFTGAANDRRGAFREANGGTLFIDEIGALPPFVQAKLLRAVEEGRIRPLGAEGSSAVKTRIVAATCEPLEHMVARGDFREDLYERLAACVVVVPALHERPGDIPAIARHLLASMGLGAVRIEPAALRDLRNRRYRGNVRELRNLLVQALVLAAGHDEIRLDDLREALEEREGRAPPSPLDLRRVFDACGGNASEAARRLGLPRSTLRDLLQRGDAEARQGGAGGDASAGKRGAARGT